MKKFIRLLTPTKRLLKSGSTLLTFLIIGQLVPFIHASGLTEGKGNKALNFVHIPFCIHQLFMLVSCSRVPFFIFPEDNKVDCRNCLRRYSKSFDLGSYVENKDRKTFKRSKEQMAIHFLFLLISWLHTGDVPCSCNQVGKKCRNRKR